ncbi:MAG: sigma-70 family RNA polymerase sigma factor [Planctomycetes bacterium]|nr:sigma-70 family RNA polymerase sigma factor [Planctomycetota bacterium]
MAEQINLETLILAHQAGVWRYLRFLGCERETADDLTQETFLKLMESEFEEINSHATAAFLRTIARNLFLSTVRRTVRVQSVEDLEVADRTWAEAHAQDDGAARLKALAGCLQNLQGHTREVLDLFYKEQQRGAEIAQRMQLSEENVRVMIHRAKQALRKCMESKLKP